MRVFGADAKLKGVDKEAVDYARLVRALDVLELNNPVFSLYIEALYCGSKLSQNGMKIIAYSDNDVDEYTLEPIP